MSIRLISFPITPNPNAIMWDDDEEGPMQNFNFIPVNWDVESNDANLYSMMLLQQVRNNIIEYHNQPIHTKDDDGIWMDLFYRDISATSQFNFDSKTYANVLIYDGEYYGHIYSWTTPKSPDICFAIGIRARVDFQSLKGTNKALPNISYYLLEALRRFACCKGCKRIVIPRPFPIMQHILSKLQFHHESISEVGIGVSVSNGTVDLDPQYEVEVYYSNDMITPFVGSDISYIFIA